MSVGGSTRSAVVRRAVVMTRDGDERVRGFSLSIRSASSAKEKAESRRRPWLITGSRIRATWCCSGM